MMKAKRAAAVALFVVSLACGAQDAPIPRPEVKAGDRWSYRRVDHETGKVLGRGEQEVTFANDRVIQLVQKNPNGQEIDVTATAEWNLVSNANSGVFYPHNGVLRFPLRPGDSWHSDYEVKFPRRGAFDVKHDRVVKVVGWEDVQVPAGRFRALKVVSEGSFQRLDRSLAGTASDTVWYVPEVKRYVKWTFESRGYRGRIEWWTLELVQYQVH